MAAQVAVVAGRPTERVRLLPAAMADAAGLAVGGGCAVRVPLVDPVDVRLVTAVDRVGLEVVACGAGERCSVSSGEAVVTPPAARVQQIDSELRLLRGILGGHQALSPDPSVRAASREVSGEQVSGPERAGVSDAGARAHVGERGDPLVTLGRAVDGRLERLCLTRSGVGRDAVAGRSEPGELSP